MNGSNGTNGTSHEAKADPFADIKAHYKEHGWAYVPNVISKERAATIIERLWEVAKIQEKRGHSQFNPFMDPNASNVRIWYQPELHNIFEELAFNEDILALVTAGLGHRPILSNFNTNVARPGSESMALHSDQSITYPGPWDNTWVFNAIWCLTDVREENGATMYLPGSHKYTTRQQLPPNAPELLKPFELKAGGVILMSGALWHTSGANVTKDEDRVCLFSYYTSPHLRSQVNWATKLSRNIQDNMSTEHRRLLCLDEMVDLSAEGDFRYFSKQYPEHAKKKEAVKAPQALET
ncbi:phytanoyl-CoA dioxygenase family protein [Xylariaceae sp. AK1471]|nr:phytanoyl-CoA dioxygenase family protein [Xylariaceae sp. AK1471]